MVQLRQSVRRLAKSPGFTLTSIFTLALGIGAATAIFSVVNGILIQPLPYPDSDRLIALTHQSPRNGTTNMPVSPAIYFTYRDNNETFRSVALWVSDTANVTGRGDPEEVRDLEVTHDFLTTLGVEPSMGRAFAAADDERGSANTVILSHGYWQRAFGGSEDVLGQVVEIDGVQYEVIGVMPSNFRFLQRPADILTTMRPVRALSFVGPLGENGIARLEDGVTLADATADVERMFPILLATFPPVPG